jgi:tRNA threonylcarbamoyladenosine biosynthesis protein TsaE
MSETIRASTAEEMIEAGRRFAAELRAGDVLALDGDLGAGKTQFCKGLAAGLEATEEVTSPTFSLVQEYRSGRLPLYHFDWYRLETAEELSALGWEDYLDEEGLLVVEWAEKFPGMLPRHAIHLRFDIIPDGLRHVHVTRP